MSFLRRSLDVLCAAVLLAALATPLAAQDKMIGINVLLNRPITDAILADLKTIGNVGQKLYEIRALLMVARESQLAVIRAKPYVAAANPDAEREGKPIDTVGATNFSVAVNAWDQDAINVSNFGSFVRQVGFNGSGVNVAVLDTGLLDTWRQYFPQQRILSQYGVAFQGGGAFSAGAVSVSPNKWEHDTSSHGTHVTSTILGYSLFGTPIHGVAPLANVIPVKVLNQNGSGFSSVIAVGIVYVTNLKLGPLAGSPMVINMSLSGPVLDAVEKAAVDYAVANGVIIVASAGNRGNTGVRFPGGYAPVISVASAGWIGQWLPGGDGNPNNWWFADNVLDPTSVSDFYISDFSSRKTSASQDLDVTAPGDWVVGPFQTQNGKPSYFFLSGTSMSSPHVAGIVALMAQKNPGLNSISGDPLNAEAILEAAALPMNSGCRLIFFPGGSSTNICWGPGNDPATSVDADGAGFITADAALTLTPP
ncbi:MAG: S8 family peptidase [Terriglobales bacterium]